MRKWTARSDWLKAGVLIGAALVAYHASLRGAFIWDDDSWTTKLWWVFRSFAGLWLIWSKPTVLQQYYPLTGTSFWLDHHFWGAWTFPYHVENVLYHGLSAVLFWRLLLRLKIKGSWFAAAVFALHPIMVESVAWITERKNVLSMPFFLGGLLAYSRAAGFWEEVPAERRGPFRGVHSWPAYVSAIFLFLAALLAKATAFCFPAVALLVAWWKRGRLALRADLVLALPFFGLSVAFGIGTAWLEKHHVGAQGPEWTLSAAERLLIAGRAVWFYVGKLVWPSNLCFVYPRWQPNIGAWEQWLYPIAVITVLCVLWIARCRIGRGPITACLFFVGSLFPVLGFMNAYFMRFSFVCDHWVYLPSLGPIALATALITDLAERWSKTGFFQGCAICLLLILAFLTWQQSKMYADSVTLWRTTATKNPAAFLAYDVLSSECFNKGLLEEAMTNSRTALQLNPRDEVACTKIADILQQQGRTEGALAYYHRALEIMPDYVVANYSLANALLRTGRIDEAVIHFQKAIEYQADAAPAYKQLGDIFRETGRQDEAIACYQKAVETHPEYVNAQNNLGNMLLERGHIDEAIGHYEAALEISPAHVEAQNNLGVALFSKGKTEEAIVHWRRSLGSDPGYIEALRNLSWILATDANDPVRNGKEALALALDANQKTAGRDALTLRTLAAAYAEVGRFADAVTTGELAEAIATSQRKLEAAAAIHEQVEGYRAGRPFHGTDFRESSSK